MQGFQKVVGHQEIITHLQNAISMNKVSHAYLFGGESGSGKKMMASMFAMTLQCEKHGVEPCMECPSCKKAQSQNHPDIIYVKHEKPNTISIDEIREQLINDVMIKPYSSPYKIYIIDEVHMLTTAAFNALLKTLEEPPAHVIFVLCTTDPQKILETILSRCQRFDFHRIGNEDIEHRLAYVCEQEGFDYDDEALAIVARHAKGGMRDALSTLEQLSVFGNGSVHADDARSLLGEVSDQILGEFSRAIADRDVAELYGLIRAQVEEGNDLLELTRDLVAHVRDVYVACVAGARAELFEGGSEQAEALAAEAAARNNDTENGKD